MRSHLRKRTAPKASSPASENPWICGRPTELLGFNWRSKLSLRSWFKTCRFSLHFFWATSGSTSSQPSPALQRSWRSILNFTVTGDTSPRGSHSFPSSARQCLFVIISWRETISSFLKEKVSSFLFQRWPSISTDSSSFDWSISLTLECHAFIWKLPFARILAMSSVSCLACDVFCLDPAISSTYAWCRSSSEASGSSSWDVLANTLIEFVAMSGAGLLPKLSRSHW